MTTPRSKIFEEPLLFPKVVATTVREAHDPDYWYYRLRNWAKLWRMIIGRKLGFKMKYVFDRRSIKQKIKFSNGPTMVFPGIADMTQDDLEISDGHTSDDSDSSD